ncbi:MAG: DUF2089 family protein [Planctomycetota bacterium]
MKVMPTICPACSSRVKVKSLVCQNCDTQIEGLYQLPPLGRLSPEDQLFLLDFVKSSGSLKEMARLLRLSYPTVRNRLDEIIERVKLAEKTRDDKGKEGG